MRPVTRRLVALAAVLVPVATGNAQAFSWTNAAGGSWVTAGNWSPAGGPPIAGDSATFNLANTYIVNLSSGTGNATDAVSVSAGNVTWQSISTTLPGVLNLTSGVGTLGVTGTGSLILGTASRPVVVSVAATSSIQNDLLVYHGSTFNTAAVNLGTSTDGLIDVLDSTFTASSSVTVGLNGHSGILSLRNSTGTFGGTLSIAVSGTTNTFGSVELTGSDVTLQSINVGTASGASGQSAALQISNGSDVSMLGASSLTVGSTSTPVASSVSVSNTATIFNTGTGAVTFRNGSALTVNSSALFNASGNTVFDASTATIASSATFDLAVNRSLTLQNASTFSVTGGNFAIDGGNAVSVLSGSDLSSNASTFVIGSNFGVANSLLVSGTNSDLNLSGSLLVGNTNAVTNHSLTLASGGDAVISGNVELRKFGNVSIGSGSVMTVSGNVTVGSQATLVESGTGNISMIGTGKLLSVNGGNATFVDLGIANTNSLRISGGTVQADTFSIGTVGSGGSAVVDGVGNLFVAGGVFMTSTGGDVSLTLHNGAEMTSGNLTLFANGNSATLSVQSGSTVDSNALSMSAGLPIVAGDLALDIAGPGSRLTAGIVYIGSTALEPARVAIRAGAKLDSNGQFQIFENSRVTLDGGTLEFASLFTGASRVEFLSGSIVSTGQTLAVEMSSALFGNYLRLDPAKSVQSDVGGITLGADGTIELAGGRLSVSTIFNNGGQLLLDRGTLTLTAIAGVGAGEALGATLRMKPDLVVNAPQLAIRGLVHGSGILNARLNNDTAGEVRVDLLDTLRFNSPTTGHTNNGRIVLNGGRIDLNHTLDNGPAGDITGRGTFASAGLNNAGDLAFSGGVSDIYGDVNNQSGGRIILSGNSNTTFWGDVNNGAGASLRVSPGSGATFFGTYGGGSITGGGQVYFEADVTPGFSPALINITGNVRFSTTSVLEMEFAGPTLGTQFDSIDVGGVALLEGKLSLLMLSAYQPQHLVAHRILSAGARQGLFTSVEGIAIDSTHYLAVTYLNNDIFVTATVPGDSDVDGDVDFDDLLILAQNYNGSDTKIWQTGDFTGNAAVEFDDLLLLAQNYGSHLLSQAQLTAIGSEFASDWSLARSLTPEPTSLGVVAGVLGIRRRRPAHPTQSA